MKCGIRYIWALIALFVLAGPAVCQTVSIGWPEAVGRLAGERSRAEFCVALLKGHGDEGQIARSQFAYGKAKADFDGVIAGLETALALRASPESLSSLHDALQRGASSLEEVCKSVGDLLPDTSGQKNVLVNIVKQAIEPLLKSLSEAVSALYNNHRQDDALTRRTIQTQLEAARWPDFAKVEAAK
jgi:hypothetical protein